MAMRVRYDTGPKPLATRWPNDYEVPSLPSQEGRGWATVARENADKRLSQLPRRAGTVEKRNSRMIVVSVITISPSDDSRTLME